MFSRKYRGFILVALALLIVLFLSIAFKIAGAAPTDSRSGCLFISEVAWSGTAASPSDEWYEVANGCESSVYTGGWFIEVVQADGAVVTSTMPGTWVFPYGDVALFERTDDNTVSTVVADGIHGGSGEGGSLVGVFTNSGNLSFGIYSEDRSEYHIIEMPDGEWPAGSSSPRASMQATFDLSNNVIFYTSNWGNERDANGDIILGSPGFENMPNQTTPATCETIPSSWEYELEMVSFEDLSFQSQVVITADLLGVDENGNLVQTDGTAYVVWITPPGAGMGSGWVAGMVEVDEGTSNECIDAIEMLKDLTENYLNERDGSGSPHPDWPQYTNWLEAILDFQRSGLFSNYLPTVISE